MISSIEPVSPSELRSRMKELRRELDVTAQQFRAAKKEGNSERVISLLRRRSSLIRELFETQSALLAALRTGARDFHVVGNQ